MSTCEFCGVPATLKCSGCLLVFYCSREHQKLDWKKSHNNKCKCYEIKQNNILGRYVVAKRDIRPGEIVMKEKNILCGPRVSSHAFCLGCNKTLTTPKPGNDFYKCSKCTWPLCGKSCENLPAHVDECNVMSAKKFKCPIRYKGDINKFEPAYSVILPMRVLLLKKKNPEMYNKIMELVSHLKERSNTPFYCSIRQNLIPFMKSFMDFHDEEIIMSIVGILDTNSFLIQIPSIQITGCRGVYWNAAMMSHECVPNTKHFMDHNLDLFVITTMAIKKGDLITNSYTTSLKTTLEKRQHLKISKCFDCVCSRCVDPTELSSYSSSLKCQKCVGEGLLVSLNPLNNLSDWKCNQCDFQMQAHDYVKIISTIRQHVERLDRKNPDDCERFLINNENLLPKQSVFLVDVKYVLCMLYGNISNYNYNDMSDEILSRKISLCLDLLEAFSIIEPGCSNPNANVDFELSAARIEEIKRRNDISVDSKKTMVDEHKRKAKTAAQILMFASENKLLVETRMKMLEQQCAL